MSSDNKSFSDKAKEGWDEMKDQYNTRTEAIKQDTKFSDQKEGTAGKIKDDLTENKENVKGQTMTESVKNAAVGAYESVKGAAVSAKDSVMEGLGYDSKDKSKS